MSWLVGFFAGLFSTDRPDDQPSKPPTRVGEETAVVPRIVKPYEVLQVGQNASRKEIKAAFRRDADQSRRQDRVMASLSYHILMTKGQRYRKLNDDSYEVTGKTDVIVRAAVGDTVSLLAHISKDSSLVTCTDEHNHSLLYLTARAGFYDTTEALLEIGVSVNEKQVDGSTALHAASFYGQRPVVELLLRYGADPTVTNRWGNTPADEADSTELKQIFLSNKEDRISQIVSSLIGKGLACRVRFIKADNGMVIAKEILRNRNVIDPRTRQELDSITSSWKSVWHGTKAEHLESILSHGLKPSGSKIKDGCTVLPPLNHFKLGEKHCGIDNWANAIFVSPRISYASHVAYSERIFSDEKSWCILIRAFVKPGTYTRHPSTVSRTEPIPGESVRPEYRIQNHTKKEEEFLLVKSGAGTETAAEFERNVVVTSVVFFSLNFLEKTPNLTFEELSSLFEKKHLS